jgi:hypothetical protein
MKRKYKICIASFILFVAIVNLFFLAFYLRHEGKYQIENSDFIYEFMNGEWLVDGKVKGSYSYSFFARKLYMTKHEGIVLFDEPWPVWIYWDHIEMPDLKGGRAKYKRIKG